MANLLDGKSAIITGGGSGIGRAAALIFAREGARIVVADVAEQGGRDTVEMVRGKVTGSSVSVEGNIAAQ